MSFFLSLLSRYGIYLVALAVISAAGLWLYGVVYSRGYSAAEIEYKEILVLRDQSDLDAKLKAEAQAKRIEMLWEQASIDQAVINAQKARKREIQYVEVTKWRTKYEKNPDAGRCVVPDEFVRVLDSTGQDGGSVPEASPGGAVVDVVTGRISDIELLQFTTDTKLMCLKWRDKLIAWQDREQALNAIQ